jgi:L-lactate dehydrogenase complex protein LldG
VVDASSIVGPYEDVWKRMADETISMPRSVNFVTGPSRTADIEQTIELGAHGPGEIHVIIVDPDSSIQT